MKGFAYFVVVDIFGFTYKEGLLFGIEKFIENKFQTNQNLHK